MKYQVILNDTFEDRVTCHNVKAADFVSAMAEGERLHCGEVIYENWKEYTTADKLFEYLIGGDYIFTVIALPSNQVIVYNNKTV